MTLYKRGARGTRRRCWLCRSEFRGRKAIVRLPAPLWRSEVHQIVGLVSFNWAVVERQSAVSVEDPAATISSRIAGDRAVCQGGRAVKIEDSSASVIRRIAGDGAIVEHQRTVKIGDPSA